MDVSDGLLIDADRLARASGVALNLDLAAVPLSDVARARCPGLAERIALTTAGDDYELLFTAPPGMDVAAVAGRTPVTRIGVVAAGQGVRLFDEGSDITPTRLGWEH